MTVRDYANEKTGKAKQQLRKMSSLLGLIEEKKGSQRSNSKAKVKRTLDECSHKRSMGPKWQSRLEALHLTFQGRAREGGKSNPRHSNSISSKPHRLVII